MNNVIVTSTYTIIKNNLGVIPNRITTWQPQHQQRVSDSIIFTLCAKLSAQCIVIGPVCGGRAGGRFFVCWSVTTIIRNCMHRFSPNWVCM